MKKEKYICSQKKNGNEYLMVKFTYKSNGKSCQYTKTFSVSDYPTRAKAMKAACEHRDLKRAELLTVGLPSGTKRTVDQCFDDYIRLYHVTLGTAKKLRSVYTNHIQPKYGSTNVSDITSMDIQNSMFSVRFTASDDVISRIKAVWRDIFKIAMKYSLVTLNPVEMAEKPKSKALVKPRNQNVNDDDIDMIINYLETHGRDEATQYNYHITAGLIILMRETGMRPAECYALSRENIDFIHKLINVTNALGSNETEENVISKTKTVQSVRQIPMTSTCEACLIDLCSISANEYIFADYYGHMPDGEAMSNRIKGVARKLGIDFHLYMLRHRFSTKMVTNGVDVRTVMELMGHASPSMTVSYARSDEAKKRSALELVENGGKD